MDPGGPPSGSDRDDPCLGNGHRPRPGLLAHRRDNVEMLNQVARDLWERSGRLTGPLRENSDMADPQYVHILWHGDDLREGSPELKLLGVYSTENAAKDRIDRCLQGRVPGFAEHPDHFLISRYEIDKDQWVEGYVEVD